MFWDKALKKYRSEYLHRVITNAPKGLVVDHINGDTLDNRRSNLRVVTHQVNCLNQHTPVRSVTGVRGVRPARRADGSLTGMFQALINGRHIGNFPSIELAAEARRREVARITSAPP